MLTIPYNILKEALLAAEASVDTKSGNKSDEIIKMTGFRFDGSKLFLESMSTLSSFQAELDIEFTEGEPQFSVFVEGKRVQKVMTKSEGSDYVYMDVDLAKAIIRVSTTPKFDSKSSIRFATDRRKRKVFKDVVTTESISGILREPLSRALDYCAGFLPPMGTNQKPFDFICFQNGICYSSNGSTMRGFAVSAHLKPLGMTYIRKLTVPAVVTSLKHSLGELITFKEDEVLQGFECISPGYTSRLSWSRTIDRPAGTDVNYLNLAGPYITYVPAHATKVMERATLSSYEGSGKSVGLELTMNQDSVDVELIAASDESSGTFACTRINDPEGMQLPYQKIVDYVIYKSVIGSSSSGDRRVYMSDPDARFFKVANVDEVCGTKFLEIGVGAYSRRPQR